MTPTPVPGRRAGVPLGCLIAALLGGASSCERESGRGSDAASPEDPREAAPGNGGIRFTDATRLSGLRAVIRSGRLPSTQILEVKGCGLALVDFDTDGDLDLFVPGGATLDDPERGPGARLFENLAEPALPAPRFRDVTARSGITLRRWAFGAAVGDADGDGLDDLHVACYGPNVLLHNDGGGAFSDPTERAGLGDRRWSTGCAFGDLDADGDLDLYVANYARFDPARPPPPVQYMGTPVLGGPHGLPPEPDAVWENLGEGRFRDVSAAWGFHAAAPAYGLNVVILDIDGNGRQDVFTANDSMANYLFLDRGGDGPPRFAEAALECGLATNGDGRPQATMGIGVGDVSGDGLPDFFTTNFSSDTNTLHVSLGGSHFADRTAEYGLGRVSWSFLGWACGFWDFDLDGDEDLLVVNGHVYPQATAQAMDSDYEQPPLLFARCGPRFHRVPAREGGPWLEEPHRDRTAVFGDLDLDGDTDAVIGELNGPVRILRNDSPRPPGTGWLQVALRDERPEATNRRGIGSRVRLLHEGRVQTRWIHGGGPFQSASAQMACFGSSRALGSVAVEVTWPDGTLERLEDLRWNQRLVVNRREPTRAGPGRDGAAGALRGAASGTPSGSR